MATQGSFVRRIVLFMLLAGGASMYSAPISANGLTGVPDVHELSLTGKVLGQDGNAVAQAHLQTGQVAAVSDNEGNFSLLLAPGSYKIHVSASNFADLSFSLTLAADTHFDIHLQPANEITVRAGADIFNPDPSQCIIVHKELLDANPGRPGMPVSVPGLPVETASGGVKAPQYFAPGVAGDHGEPIAQFFQIGDFLLPNNLPANAHGNGYADPNALVPAVIGSVQSDGGAFNPRYGDHAVSLAMAFAPRPRLDPFLQFTGDQHDSDLVAGWSPANPAERAWVAVEASAGNGFQARPEQRQQYKVNAFREFSLGQHDLTLFALGYYGFSRIPGLVPLAVPVPGDTIDSRQADLTHTAIFAASDTWHVSEKNQLQFSSFARSYSLRLDSNFGDGLIRQSETRTVFGGETLYVFRPRSSFNLLAGVDLRRDAPRGLDLGDFDETLGAFIPRTGNDLTLEFFEPFVAVSGAITRFFSYNVGVRRSEILLDNRDRINPEHSSNLSAGFTSPKATFTLAPSAKLPVVALSFGEAYHTNDVRIGAGAGLGTVVARSHAWQLAGSQAFGRNVVRVTLGRTTNSQELAKIDPDTGLQDDVGPSVIRYLTVSAQRYLSFGTLQATFSKANATDRLDGSPIPEAPRLIWDIVATSDHLPAHLHAKVETEYVGRKPLGSGFVGEPVKEFRASLLRSFHDGLLDLGMNLFLADGATGQTVETLQLADEAVASPRVVGVRLHSFAGATVTYHFRRDARKGN